MFITAIEIILAIFTVFGIYCFIHLTMDMIVSAVIKYEIGKLRKKQGKEDEDEPRRSDNDDG